MLKVSLSAALAAAITGTALFDAARADGSNVTMWKSLGSHMCQKDGATAQSLADALRSAGVDVVSVACGRDGSVRPMLCGLPDDRIAVVELPDAQEDLARAQGFAPIGDLPHWQSVSCPSGD